MPRHRSKQVIARDGCVITVGARPLVYRKIEVTDKRTGETKTIDDTDSYPARKDGSYPNITDPGDDGIPYAFKPGQRVPRDHPAVAACPGAFVDLDEAEDMGLIEEKTLA